MHALTINQLRQYALDAEHEFGGTVMRFIDSVEVAIREYAAQPHGTFGNNPPLAIEVPPERTLPVRQTLPEVTPTMSFKGNDPVQPDGTALVPAGVMNTTASLAPVAVAATVAFGAAPPSLASEPASLATVVTIPAIAEPTSPVDVEPAQTINLQGA